MTTTNGQVGAVLEGLVEQANDHGVKVQGEWRNVSKFGHPIDLPDRGARVRLELDAKGFIKTVQVLALAPPSSSTPSAPSGSRDREIRRMSVLKSAAEFLGLLSQTREEIRSDHVLVLADKWVAWVEKTDDEEEDGARF